MRLDEVFDTPYTWKWLDATHAGFMLPDGKAYAVVLNSLGGLGAWEASFGEVRDFDPKNLSRADLNYHLVGSQQNPVRIYATVADILVKFVDENSGTVQSLRMEAADKRMMGVYLGIIRRKVDSRLYHITTTDDGYMLIAKKYPSEIDV